MHKACAFAVLLLGLMTAQADGQSIKKPKPIDWLALTHDFNLSKETLLADERIEIQDKIPIAELLEGMFYLYCTESGALLDAVPIKNAYWVMIFPDPKATKFNFRVVDGDFLLKEGIDVKLLRQVLRMHKESGGMGGPSKPFNLDVRFTARRNFPQSARDTTRP